MPSAFGTAMIDTINGLQQHFRMNMIGGISMPMNCADFLRCRNDEISLLGQLNIPENGRVLDFGCGAGRHISYIRQKCSNVQCIGIETCDLLRNHCANTITAPSAFYDSWNNVPDREFDLILLMGNGLGVLGAELNAVQMLTDLVNSLRPQGQILIESGNPFGRGYYAADFTINYQNMQDGPFTWGYADQEWLSVTLSQLGCNTAFQPSNAPGNMFFFAIGRRCT